jgi:hypothetical protein
MLYSASVVFPIPGNPSTIINIRGCTKTAFRNLVRVSTMRGFPIPGQAKWGPCSTPLTFPPDLGEPLETSRKKSKNTRTLGDEFS